MDKIDIGVIGLGAMGRQHLRVLSSIDDFDVVSVYDPNPAVLEQVSQAFPGISVVTEFQELLESRVIAAVVASPTSTHAGQAEALVERGIHVLVEKPVAANIDDAARLRALAASRTVQVLVGHVERFNPAVRALKAFLQRGSLGNVVSVSASRVGVARPAMPSTNVVFDLAIHDIDVIRFMLEQPVSVLGATGGSFPGNVHVDYAHVLLACGSATGVAEANWITPRKRRKLFVTGTEGFADLDYIKQEVRAYRGSSEHIGDGSDLYHCVPRTAEPVLLPVASDEPLRAELQHFASCIKGEEDPAIRLEEAIDALACCDLASQLIRETSHGC